jgi:hypothetical protein
VSTDGRLGYYRYRRRLGALRRSEFPPPRLDQSSTSFTPSQPTALTRRFAVSSIQRHLISCIRFHQCRLGRSSFGKFDIFHVGQLFVVCLMQISLDCSICFACILDCDPTKRATDDLQGLFWPTYSTIKTSLSHFSKSTHIHHHTTWSSLPTLPIPRA